MKGLLTILITSLTLTLIGQTKKTMDHAVYSIWKKIDKQLISNDGKWVAYTTSNHTDGDPTLQLWNASNGQTQSFQRGTDMLFSEDSNFLVFKIKQPIDSLKAKRRKKVKDEDLPKDSLGIFNLNKNELSKISNVKSFALPQKWAGYLAFQLEIEKIETPKDAPKDSVDTKKPKTKPKTESKDNGTKVILHNLVSGEKDTFPFATEYIFAKKGKQFLVADTGKDSINVAGIRLFDCEKRVKKSIFQKKGKYKQLSFDDLGTQAAFVADLDTTKERVRPFDLAYWSNKADSAKVIARSNANYGSLKKYLVSENAKPMFSEDGSKLYFGIAPQPILNDTTLLPEEIVNVEVWNYNDLRVHTQQKVQLERDRKKSYDVVYYPMTGTMSSISTPELPEVVYQDWRNLDYAVTYTDEPYMTAATWVGAAPRDLYFTDLKTGAKTLIAKNIRGGAAISPAGKYVYWFNELDSAWFAYSVLNKNIKKITDNATVKFYDEENDLPDYPNTYGSATWTKDDKYILLYDRFDIWRIDPLSIEKPVKITKGRAAETVHRYVKLDDEERFVEPNAELFLHILNENTKAEGYSTLSLDKQVITPLVFDNFMFSRRVVKAKNTRQFLFSKQNFQVFPDLQYTADFKNTQRVSNVNPQQAEYNWGTIELVEWTALDGQKLRGMLVKPEGFDPKKKYPMIVNFYEKSSDQLNAHRAPEPLRSQINYAFYANRGYLVFNPDIPYRTGYPGESCLNSVVSGVSHLISEGFVDEKRVAVQGHSWGGYQAAYLITKTNIFRCAEAGAPVVNMFSAYSGIRWESGLMRQFQYEHTQSRIGGSIWEYPLRYLENSPIFSADKINTPVLILHNDKDGAVPWYQGIEFYGAMRRLGKPAWMLNYNDEPHWPVKLQNRIDFQIRMQQFFDYYLKDAPMPQWMQRGVPAMEKGIQQGYELIEKK